MWDTWTRFTTARAYRRLSRVIKAESELLEAK
jgi:hypothetical protein